MKDTEKITNLGKLLKKRIKTLGFKKYKIALALKMNRPTLDSRIEDGEFTDTQIKTLISKGYLPEGGKNGGV